MAQLKNLTINDTGYVRIAQGTTAQRVSPQTGMVRYNTDNKINEVYTGTEWRALSNSVQTATGGTVTGNIIGGYVGASKDYYFAARIAVFGSIVSVLLT